MLADQINHRRQMANPPDDFLQQLCEANNDDGTLLSVDTVVNLILLLIFAGFDTTSAHLAWGMVFLIENPEYAVRVQQEIDRVLSAAPTPDVGAIRDLPHLSYVMTEVERMRPAVSVLMRVTTEDVELGGCTIPKGWMVMISPAVSHRLERVWSCPDEYDPERFNADRQEHRRHAFTLTGFGGGMHKCTGHKFAYNELTIVLAMLFYEYAFELADPPVRPKEIEQIVRPANRIRYRRRALPIPLPEENLAASAVFGLAQP
jgi:sterol 14-demethylase